MRLASETYEHGDLSKRLLSLEVSLALVLAVGKVDWGNLDVHAELLRDDDHPLAAGRQRRAV